MAFDVFVTEQVIDEFFARQASADLAGIAEIRLAGVPFALKRNRRRDAFLFENADLRALFDLKASGGWLLQIIVRAVYLATHSLGNALELARLIATGIGLVRAERVRRFDLAADYVGFLLDRGVIDRLVTMRARRVGFLADPKDADEVHIGRGRSQLREYLGRTLNVTGITVAHGNPLMARLYDKSEELRLPGREEKRGIEHARWRSAGWDGQEPVTRVEFQHRGTYLDEASLRDPALLEAQLDRAWQADVRWLSMLEPDSDTRRARRKLDPRWQPVMDTVFVHQAEPLQRSRRHRGGARPEHVLGSSISLLASSGSLEALRLHVTEDGEVLSESSFAMMSNPEALKWLQSAGSKLFAAAGANVVRQFAGRGEPRTQARRFFLKFRGAIARFSSVDDTSEVAR